MLKFFRDQKNSWLMKGILILTALSFISLFRTRGFFERIPDEGKPVAVVAGKKITVAQYINEMNQKVRTFGKMMQKPFSMQDAVEAGMLIPVFNQMISRAVMEASVDKLKLAVSEETVRNTIKSLPIFTDYDGSFSLTAYKKYLDELGQTEKQFVDETFLDMRTAQLTNTAKAVTVVPAEAVEMAYRLENEKRTVDLFTVSPEKLKITGKPTQEEKERLYKELSDDLVAPEYRTFTVMYLTLEDVSKKIQISEEELQNVYNENKDSYTIEEIRDVDQMLFSTQEEAEKAYEALQGGQDFMSVSKKYANQTEDQTKLGEITPSTATGDWADVVFSAKKGEIIAPVQTAFGWQILRVNKITPKIEKNFKDVRDEIEQKLIASMSFDTLTETAVALDDRFGAGETIEAVAASTGYPTKTYTRIDAAGLNEAGKSFEVDKNVLATAFVTDAGRESPMIEDGSGYFVLRVDDILEPTMKPIEKSDKEINAAWTEEKQKEKAKEIIKNIENDLKKGVDVKIAASKEGIEYKRIDNLTRRNTQLPGAVTYQLFLKPVNEVISSPVQTGYVVARTIKAIPADPKKNAIGVAELRRLMQQQTADEKADAILNDFGHDLGMEIKEETLHKAFTYLTKTTQDNADEE